MRLLALWVVLFAVYAAGLAIVGRTADEAVYLRIATTLVDDGELVRVPEGAGFPLLVAPAEALGGARAVELLLAAIAAAGFVLGALLARRIVPEPYASGGAALCAVAARDRPRVAGIVGAAAMLAALPWIGLLYLVPALPVAITLYVWCRRARRPLLALISAELVVGSLVVYATLNEQLYGGPTPWSAGPPGSTATGADSAVDYAERVPRLAGLWLDPGDGLLRWAPVLVLAFFAAWLLWRSRREQLALVAPARAGAEAAAALALAICGAQLIVAAFLVPAISGDWFPARHLMPALPVAAALVAWGLRHAPRAGGALGAVTLGISAWVLVAGY